MKRFVVGMKKEFVDSFIAGLKELGIRVCGEPFELDGLWRVMCMPIGKEQEVKYEQYVEYRCKNDLL